MSTGSRIGSAFSAFETLTLDQLSDVTITSPVDNNLLAYDSASSLWINQTATEAGVVPTSRLINTTSPLAGGGDLSADRTLTITGSALTKTDDTNVTLTLGGTPSTALLVAASLTLGWTGQLALTRGGTNASLTASNGGIVYSTASAFAILAGTATANQLLLSGLSTTPSWSTSTYPATNAVSTLLYASSANVMAALATANSGVLVTSGTGVPSISTDIPTAVTIGTAYIYRVGGTDVSVADGGTGASTASGARTNLGLAIGSDVQAWDVNLDQIAALAPTDNNFIVGTGTVWALETPSDARTSLGLVAGGAGDIWVEKAGDTMTGALIINNALTVNADTTLGDNNTVDTVIANVASFTISSGAGTGSVVVLTNGLTSGIAVDIQVSGTFAAASQTALNILTAGANGTAAITAYGAQISNTHTNATSGTNIALYLNASGATTANYALSVNSGTVWISSGADGTTSTAGIIFGLSLDTNLYRSAANTLKSDDSLVIDINLTVNGNTVLGNAIGTDTLTVSALTSAITSSATTQTSFSLLNTNLSTGKLFDLSGTVTVGVGVDAVGSLISITATPTGSSGTFKGLDLEFADGTTRVNTIYGLYTGFALSGAAAKVGYGIYETASSSSTTADTLTGAYFAPTQTGNVQSGTKNLYGIQVLPTSTGPSTSTTAITNVYGAYIKTTASHAADAGTVNEYGLYIDNQAGSTNGTSVKFGILVIAQTGADNNYGVAIQPATQRTLWISSNTDSTTAAGGITFGSSADTNLYRSAANFLATDDTLHLTSATATLRLGSNTSSAYYDIGRVGATGVLLFAGEQNQFSGYQFDITGGGVNKNVLQIAGISGNFTINEDGNDLDSRFESDTNANIFFIDGGSSNVGIGVTAWGTSAATVLGIANGTEPSTSPADMVQLYSVDLSAGNATLGLRTETAVVTEVVVSDRTLSVRINGTTYKIMLKS